MATMTMALRGGAAGSSGGGVTCGGAWCGSSVDLGVSVSIGMIAEFTPSTRLYVPYSDELTSRMLNFFCQRYPTTVTYGKNAWHKDSCCHSREHQATNARSA